jgi:hypothetical protein
VVSIATHHPLPKYRSTVAFGDGGKYDGQGDRGEQMAFVEFLSGNPKLRAEPFKQLTGQGCAFILGIES